ncbi:TIGR04255 family protein [Cronobacter muytjensii]
MPTPTSLTKQPVIEASFELRYPTETQVSEIIPGFLFHALNCSKPIINLPPSQIPRQVREMDEQLYYSVVSQLEVGDYNVGISDHGIIVSTRGQYFGWTAFKETIIRVINELNKLNLNHKIIRYSLKYVDFFESQNEKSLFNKLNMNFEMAGQSLSTNPLTIRVDLNKDEFVNIIQVLTHALVTSQNGNFNKKGMIVDIDTVRNISMSNECFEFINNLEKHLDRLHDCNKNRFFECLKKETIEELGPVYSDNNANNI